MIVKRFLKITLAAFALIIVALIARYLYVQNEIKNAPLEVTQYSKSGYTPPGVWKVDIPHLMEELAQSPVSFLYSHF